MIFNALLILRSKKGSSQVPAWKTGLAVTRNQVEWRHTDMDRWTDASPIWGANLSSFWGGSSPKWVGPFQRISQPSFWWHKGIIIYIRKTWHTWKKAYSLTYAELLDRYFYMQACQKLQPIHDMVIVSGSHASVQACDLICFKDVQIWTSSFVRMNGLIQIFKFEAF